jgi:hypothetical protein
VNRQSTRYNGWVILAIFICSFCLFGVRNLEPLTFPTVFAEDGIWTSKILMHGFFETAFRSRTFPIFGIVALDQLAIWLSSVLPGGLLRLPLALFVVCNGFLALTATIILCSLRDHMPLLVRIGMWSAFVLMPVGIDGNEIFGRALNLGFVFPVLQVFLLAGMLCDLESRPKSLWALLGALLAGWSFPVGIGINAIALVLLCRRGHGRWSIAMPWQAWVLLAVILANLAFLQPEAFVDKGGAANLPYTQSGLIEFALARSVLFPLVGPIYRHLNDPLVLILALVVSALMITLLLKVRHKGIIERRLVFLFVGSFVTYAITTVIMRIGFTALFLGAYRLKGIDRYFYGLNTLAVCTVLITLVCAVDNAKWWKRVAYAWLALSFIAPLIDRQIIELAHPRINWREHGTFQDELCASAIGKGIVASNFKEAYTTIAIYPRISENTFWTMQLPTAFVSSLAGSRYCKP